MGEPMTNGASPSSHTLSHLGSYPVVNDLVSTYKTNPYGAKSLELSNAAFDKFGKPVIPYLQGPYSWLHPYIARADSLADSGLGKVDERFPIVKEDAATIKDNLVDVALLPLRLVGTTKNYVFSTYDDEYQKTGGNGLITTAKAIVSTELKITADVFQRIADYLGPKKEEAKKKIQEKTNN